jgi:hypothetical protein
MLHQDYCQFCKGDAEGVAAPLEPSTDKFLLDYCKSTSMTLNFGEIVEVMNLFAAAVSKNLQEAYDRERQSAQKWAKFWNDAQLEIAELEKEITALRETK